MEEIVIKNDLTLEDLKVQYSEMALFQFSIRSGTKHIAANTLEARQLADAIYKVCGEPTREECFEAGRQTKQTSELVEGDSIEDGFIYPNKYNTFTDYINEYKNQNNGK